MHLDLVEVIGRARDHLEVVEPAHGHGRDAAASHEHVAALEDGPRVREREPEDADADDDGRDPDEAGDARRPLDDARGGQERQRASDVEAGELGGGPPRADVTGRAEEREGAERAVGAVGVDGAREAAHDAAGIAEMPALEQAPPDGEEDGGAHDGAGGDAVAEGAVAGEQEREDPGQADEGERDAPAGGASDGAPGLGELEDGLGEGGAHGRSVEVSNGPETARAARSRTRTRTRTRSRGLKPE